MELSNDCHSERVRSHLLRSLLTTKGPHHGLASVSFQNRADKKRLNIIIVAEGAIDCHNKAITPDYIKDVSKQTEPV